MEYMSMLFVLNNEFVGFSKYMLSESVIPKITNYGTNSNMSDNKWLETSLGYITYTKSDNTYYCIWISKSGEAMFLSSKEVDISKLNDIDYIINTFDTGRTQTKRIINLFGEIIYILLQGAIKYRFNPIYFDGADKGLDKTYEYMVKNKYLLNKIEEYGYKYKNYDGRYFYFISTRH